MKYIKVVSVAVLAVLIIVVGVSLYKSTAPQQAGPPTTQELTPSPSALIVTGEAVATTLTTADVAQHATAADCWIIIDVKVYDVTDYLNSHPGGAREIIPFCGRDATDAFKTQGGRGSHSAQADADLTRLYLGDILVQ